MFCAFFFFIIFLNTVVLNACYNIVKNNYCYLKLIVYVITFFMFIFILYKTLTNVFSFLNIKDIELQFLVTHEKLVNMHEFFLGL